MAEQTRSPALRVLRVVAFRHRSSDLLTAVSDDLHGFAAIGRTPEALQADILSGIRQTLEAEGLHVSAVTIERLARSGPVSPPVTGLVDAHLQFRALAQIDAA